MPGQSCNICGGATTAEPVVPVLQMAMAAKPCVMGALFIHACMHVFFIHRSIHAHCISYMSACNLGVRSVLLADEVRRSFPKETYAPEQLERYPKDGLGSPCTCTSCCPDHCQDISSLPQLYRIASEHHALCIRSERQTVEWHKGFEGHTAITSDYMHACMHMHFDLRTACT